MNFERVCVTGGAGFIGSHLVERLIKQEGCEVVVFDNLTRGCKINPDIENVEIVKGDILNKKELENALKNVDIVFHLAALTSVRDCSPEKLNEVNVTGTLNVLNACVKKGVSKIVYASSAGIYGHQKIQDLHEGLVPNPQSVYGTTKLVGEYYCKNFHELYGPSILLLRYFNVYGPRQNEQGVVHNFISSILNGKMPVIFGSGKQTRDLVYVEDVVNATLLMVERGKNTIYNVGSGESVSINKLFRTVAEIMGREVSPVYKNKIKGEIIHSKADITKAKKLGYRPKYDLKEGLERTIKWYKMHNCKWYK